jgi:crossover junction endodeoxyribonuclease RuvC
MSLQTILLGIDPGLQRTGWGVIACEGARISWVAHGVIAPPTKLALTERLGLLAIGIKDVLDFYNPTEAAVEEVFMAKNAQSALLLGHARGATLSVLAQHRVAVQVALRRTKSPSWFVACCLNLAPFLPMPQTRWRLPFAMQQNGAAPRI